MATSSGSAVLASIAEALGIGLLSAKGLRSLKSRARRADQLERVLRIMSKFQPSDMETLLPLLHHSRSQFLQDFFVTAATDVKRGGYFVEFGAGNGVHFSNTLLLEVELGWHGILAEPVRSHKRELLEKRRARIDTRCVWSESGQTVAFLERDNPDLSSIDQGDTDEDPARIGATYPVETVSLLDLLRHHRAPAKIDYLSIDTEGTEYEILQNFDFEQFQFQVVTCEHNFRSDRPALQNLFRANGYEHCLEDISGVDDWFVYTG